jgi:hypothetical protein
MTFLIAVLVTLQLHADSCYDACVTSANARHEEKKNYINDVLQEEIKLIHAYPGCPQYGPGNVSFIEQCIDEANQKADFKIETSKATADAEKAECKNCDGSAPME